MSLTGKTILQVIPNLSAGGAERTTIEIAEAMKAAGGKSLVVSAGGRLEGELLRAGGELIKLDNAGSKNPLSIYAHAGVIAKVAKQNNVALLLAASAFGRFRDGSYTCVSHKRGWSWSPQGDFK